MDPSDKELPEILQSWHWSVRLMVLVLSVPAVMVFWVFLFLCCMGALFGGGDGFE